MLCVNSGLSTRRSGGNLPRMRYLQLFFLIFLFAPALSEPWYDELLFEYRREGTLLDFQQESVDKYQAVVAYPLWKIVGGMESASRSRGWAEDFTLQPDFAVLRTPRTKLGEHRHQVVLLAYSIDPQHTRLHFAVEGSPQSTHFEMLAMGLTACRYFEQPDRYRQVIERAQTSTRLSTDPPFPFPPSSVVEAPSPWNGIPSTRSGEGPLNTNYPSRWRKVTISPYR